jgi:hypothetical protein
LPKEKGLSALLLFALSLAKLSPMTSFAILSIALARLLTPIAFVKLLSANAEL